MEPSSRFSCDFYGMFSSLYCGFIECVYMHRDDFVMIGVGWMGKGGGGGRAVRLSSIDGNSFSSTLLSGSLPLDWLPAKSWRLVGYQVEY